MNRTEYFKAYYQENKAKILDRVRERNYVVREAQKEEREECGLFKKINKPIIIDFHM